MTKNLFYILLASLMFFPVKGLLPIAVAQSWEWGRGSSVGPVESWCVATDSHGNVYGAGVKIPGIGSPVSFGIGATVGPSTGSTQAIWVKYDSAGTMLWADGTLTGNTWIYDITTDPADNLILFGSFNSTTMQIGTFTLVNLSPGGRQFFLAKVTATGTVLWAVADGDVSTTILPLPGGTANALGCGVTTDTSGNIYITTSFKSATMTVGSLTLTNSDPSGTTNDVLVY